MFPFRKVSCKVRHPWRNFVTWKWIWKDKVEILSVSTVFQHLHLKKTNQNPNKTFHISLRLFFYLLFSFLKSFHMPKYIPQVRDCQGISRKETLSWFCCVKRYSLENKQTNKKVCFKIGREQCVCTCLLFTHYLKISQEKRKREIWEDVISSVRHFPFIWNRLCSLEGSK